MQVGDIPSISADKRDAIPKHSYLPTMGIHITEISLLISLYDQAYVLLSGQVCNVLGLINALQGNRLNLRLLHCLPQCLISTEFVKVFSYLPHR